MISFSEEFINYIIRIDINTDKYRQDNNRLYKDIMGITTSLNEVYRCRHCSSVINVDLEYVSKGNKELLDFFKLLIIENESTDIGITMRCSNCNHLSVSNKSFNRCDCKMCETEINILKGNLRNTILDYCSSLKYKELYGNKLYYEKIVKYICDTYNCNGLEEDILNCLDSIEL